MKDSSYGSPLRANEIPRIPRRFLLKSPASPALKLRESYSPLVNQFQMEEESKRITKLELEKLRNTPHFKAIYQPKQWKDVFFFCCFVVSFLPFVFLWSNMLAEDANFSDFSYTDQMRENVNMASTYDIGQIPLTDSIEQILYVVVISIVIGYGMMFFMSFFALYITWVITIALPALIVIPLYLVYPDNVITLSLGVLVSVIIITYCMYYRRDISKSAFILQKSCQSLISNKVLSLLPIFAPLLLIPYFLMYLRPFNYYKTDITILLFLIFHGFWVLNSLAAITRVVVCGVISKWFFEVQSSSLNNLVSTLKKTLTTSLGSVVLGSLILATVSTLGYILDKFEKKMPNWLYKVLSCIFQGFKNTVGFVSSYAFVYVALYGESFFDSSREVTHLITNNVNQIVLNKFYPNLISRLSFALSAAILLVCVYFIPSSNVHESSKLVGILVGLYLQYTINVWMMTSGAKTILVCYFECMKNDTQLPTHMAFLEEFAKSVEDVEIKENSK
eukprot:TRINITY_DN10852_c0_g1_i1.p1 TRINITY_DN10852_c0_g1~~TRINITY_DN10852_c0_g1_i1.p1  ORF type:complete len:504 (+),score=55.30 TRINITY_DN10852_c0_g1_i1:32-1543(+)